MIVASIVEGKETGSQPNKTAHDTTRYSDSNNRLWRAIVFVPWDCNS